MKICVISYGDKFHAPKRLLEEGGRLGHDMYFATWEDICVEIGSEGLFVGTKERDLKEFDAILPRSDRYSIKIKGRRISRNMNTVFHLVIEYCSKNNIFFLNSKYFSGYQSLDKITQQYFFFENSLPGIRTLVFTEKDKLRMPEKVNFPVVAKLSEGSCGGSVFLIKNEKELEKFVDIQNGTEKSFLVQEFHRIDADYRVLVMNGKALGTMKRVATREGEWRTNVSLGGEAIAEKNGEAMEGLAVQVAEKMGFDYVGVDLLKDGGKIYIIETNSLAMFKGFEEAFPKVNVAKKMIELAEKKAKEKK